MQSSDSLNNVDAIIVLYFTTINMNIVHIQLIITIQYRMIDPLNNQLLNFVSVLDHLFTKALVTSNRIVLI
jgi:hypothetical protein